jgi:Domain of unknown function (DUF4760)
MTEIQAVLLTGLLATLVAVWGVISQRQITRRKTTLELIARNEADHDLLTARGTFIRLAKASGGLAKWAEAKNINSTEAQAIRLFLNQFELTSIGIQKGVLDGPFWSFWYKSGTVLTWSYAEPFIKVLRVQVKNDMIYHEFEELAKALKGDTMPKRNWWLGRFF